LIENGTAKNPLPSTTKVQTIKSPTKVTQPISDEDSTPRQFAKRGTEFLKKKSDAAPAFDIPEILEVPDKKKPSKSAGCTFRLI